MADWMTLRCAYCGHEPTTPTVMNTPGQMGEMCAKCGLDGYRLLSAASPRPEPDALLKRVAHYLDVKWAEMIVDGRGNAPSKLREDADALRALAATLSTPVRDEPAEPSGEPRIVDGRLIEGTWPDHCEQRAFVAGAKWWEFTSTGGTMWPSDRDKAEAEAIRRYGDPAGRSSGVRDESAAGGQP